MSASEPLDQLLARSLRVSGVVLVVLGVYAASQWVALAHVEEPDVIDRDVFWVSSLVNCGLFAMVALHNGLLRLLRRRASLSAGAFVGLTFGLGVVVEAVWVFQYHLGGSQSCNLFMVILASLAVFAWLLPGGWLVALTALTLAGMAGVTLLELNGVLDYAPIFTDHAALGAAFLTGHVLALNVAVTAAAFGSVLPILLHLRRTLVAHQASLEANAEHLRLEVAERGSAEERLRASIADLERSNRDLEQFGNLVSHDLKAPLRAVRGYLGVLAEDAGNVRAGEPAECLSAADDAARRMENLIDDLLAYSKIHGSRRKPVACDVGRAVDDAQVLLRGVIAETGAEIACGPMPTVLCDPGRLIQVFENLLGNSLRYRSEAPPRIRVEARAEGDEWLLSVADNGVGFDPRFREKIFDAFERLSPSRHTEGTGIGLAICRRIVEQYGGRIWADSRPGEGATFTFCLPAARPDEPVPSI
jgi:signal transduction histidine kinase